MNPPNKVLIITADTLIGLGLRTLLTENFGLLSSFASSWHELPISEFRMKEFQLIFCDEHCMKGIPSQLSQSLKQKIIVLVSNKDNQSRWQSSLNVDQHFDQLIPAISKILESRFMNNDARSTQLTSREVEVLKLLARGYINKEIADILSISTHTVISHRKNISIKLGIKTVPGLTVYATINGFISPDTIL